MEMELNLTQEDRARLIDSKHKIQSAQETLASVDARKIPCLSSIRQCLRDSDLALRGALRSVRERITNTKFDELQ